MTTVEVLREAAADAFGQLARACEGLAQPQAWGLPPLRPEEWLNTDGSVHGIVLHVAGGKKAFGSIAFRGGELRWRDIADELEAAEKTWETARTYLAEAHRYWLDSWAHLDGEGLRAEAPHFSGQRWPVWRIVQTVTLHDAYHAGQVALVRAVAPPSDMPPPSAAEDVRTHCCELPNW
ncbi:MAG: hypothetical protein KIT11_00410 [Fimbriimonadaceae bacterium]|nr:hypothetical protein [Fimbriimonadaceae bacterium]QYK55165.1 MAG: hypothetical protein KF733_09125 [Fimbriimonadaceae bacterium]